ncbi:MAG: hypothetical protein GF375_06500 [Candidatus Omnitrophica bacterium]|nr:hypothetical protein [Candidatus Omnitrophota bacterium]MBD3269624.1 hypothetical protein [Candidatus Omnitrophota bacterium]
MSVEGGVVCADSSWNKDGTKIVAYVKTDRKQRSGAILIIDTGRAE